MKNNKIIGKKIRNVIILGMMLLIMIGTYINIRNSRAEDIDNEILLKIEDIYDEVKAQEITLELINNEDGSYSVEFSNIINSYIVSNFYNSEGEKILFEGEEKKTEETIDNNTEEETLEEEAEKKEFKEKTVKLNLTEEQIKNGEININALYDTKTIELDKLEGEDQTTENNEEEVDENSNETIDLYNKIFTYNEEVEVIGYMPENAELKVDEEEFEEKELEELYKTTFSNIKHKIQISIYENPITENEIEKEGTDDTLQTEEVELIQYNPETYGETITIKTIHEVNTIICLDSENKYVEISELETQQGKIDIVVTEEINVKSNVADINVKEGSNAENNDEETGTISLSSNTLRTTNLECNGNNIDGTTSPFLGNSTIKRAYITSLTFLSDVTNYTITNPWDVSANRDGSLTAWYTGTQSSGYSVYIYNSSGTSTDIIANKNSSYLFAYLGNAMSSLTINGLDLLKTSNVTDMSNMFDSCGSLGNLELNYPNFNTSNVTDMRAMFASCKSLRSLNLNLSNFDTTNVINMNRMFNNCEKLTALTLGQNFNTENVTSMSQMFYYCIKLTSLNLSTANFDTSNVTNMSQMFDTCRELRTLNLGTKFNTENVSTFYRMFLFCNEIRSLDLGNYFNTSSATNMGGMFADCTNLTSLNLGDNFNTSRVTNMSDMFLGCRSFETIDLKDKFDTSSATNMQNMFESCEALTSLDLGDKFYTSNVNNMSKMFMGCSSLTSLDLGPNFTQIASSNANMFSNCGTTGTEILVPIEIYYYEATDTISFYWSTSTNVPVDENFGSTEASGSSSTYLKLNSSATTWAIRLNSGAVAIPTYNLNSSSLSVAFSPNGTGGTYVKTTSTTVTVTNSRRKYISNRHDIYT